MAKLRDYLAGRSGTDAAIRELEEAVQELETEQVRQKSITDYNLMMGTLEDPEEEEEEDE